MSSFIINKRNKDVIQTNTTEMQKRRGKKDSRYNNALHIGQTNILVKFIIFQDNEQKITLTVTVSTE